MDSIMEVMYNEERYFKQDEDQVHFIQDLELLENTPMELFITINLV